MYVPVLLTSEVYHSTIRRARCPDGVEMPTEMEEGGG